MRNLKVLLNANHQNALLAESDLVVLGKRPRREDFALKLDDVFCISKNVIYRIQLDGYKVIFSYDLSDYFGSQEIPKAISMWFRDLSDFLSVCFETGEILTWACNQPGTFPNSHLLSSSVTHINWSPDEEFAIVISSFDKLYLVNEEFYIISDINLSDSSLGEKQLINVGWGKKETQFHGSEGKQAAIASKDSVNDNLVQESFVLKTTWRGDSCLFAVGYWCQVKNRRLVKIFNNEGILQCVSEEIQGLEEPLFWSPKGNLIAFSQQLPNKYVIGFMEKNGLKHGEFTLPSYLKVKDINWNEDSTILCTICENKNTKDEEILLWTTGNYHWYLKQKLKLKSPSKSVWWGLERPNRLYVWRSNGDLQVFEWAFVVDSSYNSSCEKLSNVAVIDGDDILVTSFKNAIVPPPLSSFKLKCPETVNQVLFPPVNSAENLVLCAILANGSVAIFEESKTEPLVLSTISDLHEPLPELLSLAHWEWADKDALILCYSIGNELHILHLLLGESSLSLRNLAKVKGDVITCSRAQGKVLIQTSEGKLINYNIPSMTVGSEEFSFAEPSVDVKIHATEVYCLSEWGRFYMNGSQISLPAVSGHITSFLLRDPFILLTTSAHKLIILQSSTKTNNPSERKLERGSRLITVSGDLVVLQTPRGNLETIQPRALTVLSIGELIDAKLYKEAFCLLRKQRINLNILVDHDKSTFYDDLEIFVEELDPQWITLFITELSEEDVSGTTYSHFYKPKTPCAGTKINAICEKLIEVMSKDEENKKKFEIPILSALVKMDLMEEAIKWTDTDQKLQHLMFLVDPNKLYLEALGVYDLEFALKVAEKSHKDPKEYLPYLNSLREMEPNYMKFVIDKSLNRNTTALRHIAWSTEDHLTECYDFIKEHSLYQFAFLLFRDQPERRAVTCLMLAEHAFNNRSYEEAGIMYLKGGDKEKAIQSFTRAGDWHSCMAIAIDEAFSEERCRLIAENICNMLVSSHQFSDAATVYLEWLSDVEKAVEMYIQGKCWKEAIYTAKKHNKPELLENIKNALLKSTLSFSDTMHADMTKLQKYATRLEKVRKEKQNRPAFVYDEISDTASDTSSTSSQRTKSFQSRSSRHTKKMSRKMMSLKEGNPREEEALVAAISQSLQTIEKYACDTNATISALLKFDEYEEASLLQYNMELFLKSAESYKKTVWPKEQEIDEATLLDDKYKHPPEINIMPDWKFLATSPCKGSGNKTGVKLFKNLFK